MTNQELYKEIEEKGLSLPSTMGVFPSTSDFIFNEQLIKNNLQKNNYFELNHFEIIDNNGTSDEVIKQEYKINVTYLNEDYTINLYVVDAKSNDYSEFGFGNLISENELDLAMQQNYYLEADMYFGNDALDSFHLQLKVLQSIVENPSIVVDFMPFRLLSGKWAKLTAKSEVPPAPSYLYTIHGVYDEIDGEKIYWLHTHGLHRCGSVELEMLNIKNGIEQLNSALDMIVNAFIKADYRSPENQEFNIGYDGLDITFCWKRWEDVVKNYQTNIPGGYNDRQPENENYEPSGVLLAVQEGITVSPEIYTSTIADNPIFFISDQETERMSAMAYQRFNDYKKVFKKYFNPEAEDENYWRFLVKLGFDVDHEMKKEHIWFDVYNITDNNEIVAVCLNRPYAVDGLNEGDEGIYPQEMITDWLIYTPTNTITSDNIYSIID
ncbi:DUF4026 domain-containing protein [Chishuiella sp.]|uniref:DUF4026 domain-containing protein n=1 Tax=Chishuiella sp. TaxID=1969467 RepID=UPI0028AEC83E|nr:DUF4026 domain-containing protein [Chishuiella sp.]